jgi:putative transposase
MRYRRLRIAGGTYAFTVVTGERRPVFADAAAVDMLMLAFSAVREKRPFEMPAHVILPDHLHCIWVLPEGDANFSTRWRQIKEGFTRSYLRHHAEPPRDERQARRGERSVWQHRFWEHLVRDQDDLNAQVEYIHMNPVSHGLAPTPLDWPHSSFHAYVERGEYDAHWGADVVPTLDARHEPAAAP